MHLGDITDKKYLPITRLNFGGTQLETSSGIYTLGKFECNGKVRINGIPKSCTDLWKIGHTLSGIYSVMGSDFVETVYCDFAQLPLEHGNNGNIIYYKSFKWLRWFITACSNRFPNVDWILRRKIFSSLFLRSKECTAYCYWKDSF